MNRAPWETFELGGALLAVVIVAVNARWLVLGGGAVALVGTACGAVALVMWLARPWFVRRRPDRTKWRRP